MIQIDENEKIVYIKIKKKRFYPLLFTLSTGLYTGKLRITAAISPLLHRDFHTPQWDKLRQN